jgi:hypothetical protein
MITSGKTIAWPKEELQARGIMKAFTCSTLSFTIRVIDSAHDSNVIKQA